MCEWTEGDLIPLGASLVEGQQSGRIDQMVLPRPACDAGQKMCYCMLTERDRCRVAAHLEGTPLPPSPKENLQKTPMKEDQEKDHSFSSGSIPNAQRTQSRRGSGQSATRHTGRVTNADIYDHLEAQQ